LNLAKDIIVKSLVKILCSGIFTELLTIVTLARFKYELPDDGHRPKHVGAF
jgi:hypothetical protein